MPTNPNDEVKEMEDVFNDILDKTDEEIQKLDEDDAKKKLDGAGEPIKDPTDEANDPKPVAEDPIKPVGDQDTIPDTTDEVTALQTKVADLEDQLKKEHQRTSSWDGRIKAANSRVKELELENQSLKDELAKKPAEPTEDEQTEQEIMDGFLTTFPEFTEVLGMMQKKIDNAVVSKPVDVTPAKADPEPESNTDLDVNTEEDRIKARKEHMGSIRKAHPAIDEMVKAGVILTWINEQPDFISSHLEDIYYNGSSDKIIKMVTEFTKKTGWKSSLNTGKAKQDKLNSMLESEGDSAGPKSDGPDKNDFAQGVKDAGL